MSIRLQKSLENLDNLNDRIRIHQQRLRINHMIGKRSIVEDYINGDLTIVCNVVAQGHGNIPGRHLFSPPSTSGFLNFTSFVLCFNALNGGIVRKWNQQAMFVSDVELVNGPNSKIPSLVRFYLGRDELEQFGTGSLYFSPIKRGMKLIGGFVNREFGEIADSRGNESLNGLEPCIVDGTLQIMDDIPEYQSYISECIPVGKIVFDDFISTTRINLDRSSIGIFQKKNSVVQLRDMMIGPFNFKSGISEIHANNLA